MYCFNLSHHESEDINKDDLLQKYTREHCFTTEAV